MEEEGNEEAGEWEEDKSVANEGETTLPSLQILSGLTQRK